MSTLTLTGALGAILQGVQGGIGTAGATIGIYQYQKSLQSYTDDPWTKIRMHVAHNVEIVQANGDLPDVRLWDGNMDYQGITIDPGYVEDGTYKDFYVEQKDNSQPTRILLSANDNAICLAYLQQTWPDDQNYLWVGTWGASCDQGWYMSNVILDGKKLYCTWLDKDGNAPGNVTGLGLHMPEFQFNGEGDYNNDTS